MSVTGVCPNCGYERAQFLNIDSNRNVAVDCSPGSGCNFQAAVPLGRALELIEHKEFPLGLS